MLQGHCHMVKLCIAWLTSDSIFCWVAFWHFSFFCKTLSDLVKHIGLKAKLLHPLYDPQLPLKILACLGLASGGQLELQLISFLCQRLHEVAVKVWVDLGHLLEVFIPQTFFFENSILIVRKVLTDQDILCVTGSLNLRCLTIDRFNLNSLDIFLLQLLLILFQLSR